MWVSCYNFIVSTKHKFWFAILVLAVFLLLVGVRYAVSPSAPGSTPPPPPEVSIAGGTPKPEAISSSTPPEGEHDATHGSDNTIESATAEADVMNQPAYLVTVFAKEERYYVTLDYVVWFRGEGQREAMQEDGRCSPDDCYVFPNGYKRNKNPMLRTLPIAPNATIELRGVLSMQGKSYPNIANVSPGELLRLGAQVEVMALLPDSSFAKSKSFVIVDIASGQVTKLVEPYQE